MPLQRFEFRPGINKEGTDYSNENGWFDSNLVRFRKGLPEKIGGWVKSSNNTFLATCRALHAWVDIQLTSYLGLGTTWKYYIKEGDNYQDITPIRATTTNGITFAATNGSSIITATDSSHGAVENDFVTIAGAVSLGGVITAAVLNQEYQITGIPSANTYTFIAKDTSGDAVTANASDSGNGGSGVDGAYQINVGLDVYVQGSGWGAGTWGAGTFGSVSGISASSQLRNWSHDNFGEDLLINPRGGGVFYWDESSGTTQRAVALGDLSGANLAPNVALQVLVSDVDRHVICFGADPLNTDGTARTGASDPLFIAWSDQENAAQWEPLSSNTAGSFRLSAGSAIIGAVRARQETLIWTDVSLYSMSFIGQPFVFSINLVNEGVGLISPNAMINTPRGVFWMDKKGFYTYNGNVSDLPCTVQDYVLSDINEEQAFQTFSFLNKEFDEVGWFYCSSNSSAIDKYVVYNYEDNAWSIGELSRSAWLDEGVFNNPVATLTDADYVGYLYDHEVGNDDDGTPMNNVFIESSDFDLGEGEEFQSISRVIPDVKFTGNGGSGQTINVVLKQRNFPGESLSTNVTSTCTSTTTKIDTRLRARQAALRIESDDDNTDGNRLGVGFRIGITRMNVQANGRR
tara:strand:+ start:189 stop:2078 length:1890 start_codon:yes stop_codon:yes gene_type:complete